MMLRPSKLTVGRRRVRLLGIVAIVLAVASVASGCDKVTGGGWIQSLTLVPGDKATFGFTARCKDTTTVDGVPVANFYDGQFEFDDHAFNPLVRVHGVVEPSVLGTVPGETCAQAAAEFTGFPVAKFSGTFRTQSQILPVIQGEFFVDVTDAGEPGRLKLGSIDGDTICVSLFGPGIAYDNCGAVQGGNIQVQ